MERLEKGIPYYVAVAACALILLLFADSSVFAATKKVEGKIGQEYLILDRIEGSKAVLEQADGTMIVVNLSRLPKKVKEGDVIRLKKGKYRVDRAATKKRQAALKKLYHSLTEIS